MAEEFWDHGDFEHGHTLYDELLNVPYILKMPGIEVGMHDEPVSLLDLVPTTKALGIEIEQHKDGLCKNIRIRP